MIQEHWLTPDNMNNILQFSEHYSGFGVSAMINTISSGIRVARLYYRSLVGSEIMADRQLYLIPTRFLKEMSDSKDSAV